MDRPDEYCRLLGESGGPVWLCNFGKRSKLRITNPKIFVGAFAFLGDNILSFWSLSYFAALILSFLDLFATIILLLE